MLTLNEEDYERGIEYFKQQNNANTEEIVPLFEVDDQVIVEWRAMTVALLDVIAGEVRDIISATEEQLPLAKVLESGTWTVSPFLSFFSLFRSYVIIFCIEDSDVIPGLCLQFRLDVKWLNLRDQLLADHQSLLNLTGLYFETAFLYVYIFCEKGHFYALLNNFEYHKSN